MMHRSAIATVLLTAIAMLLHVAANTVELDHNGEVTTGNPDETSTTQNIVKILYCTS
jgi:hypothetical protein